jgi:hypothetical protein
VFTTLAIGTAVIGATVAIHSLGMVWLILTLRRLGPDLRLRYPQAWSTLIMVATVLLLFALHGIEIWLWAGVYRVLTDLPDLESALYFSTVTYTTLGYGDVVLAPPWRMLASLEAANGILLFGWTTAFLFALVRRVWQQAGHIRDDKET